jgi:eukaryotic-like serine/threonine-protein kinase
VTDPARPTAPIRLGRYALFDELAAGGMATVHLGRLIGPVGFSRTVAIKRLHPQHARDPEFVTMLLDEARLAARIRHPNVVATLDVVATEGEVFLVMEYVEGESLAYVARLLRRNGQRIPPPIASHIVAGALHGLHAAHEAKDDRGAVLGLVHRDVSPQNILVGVDGVPRVLDFGVAKAAGRLQTTDQGRIKGKLSYMAPEQLSAKTVSRKTDIFAAGVVLWEALSGKRLFEGDDPGEVVAKVLSGTIEPPRTFASDIPRPLDAVVMRALARKPDERFETALVMAEAIEAAAGLLPPRQVGEWLKQVVGSRLEARAARVAEVESISSVIASAAVDVAVFAGARAAAYAETPSSSRKTRPETGEPGTGRSQVSSVVSKEPEAPKRRAARWVPYVVGLCIVAIPAAVLWSLHGRPSENGSPEVASPPSASALSFAASPVAPSSASAGVAESEAGALVEQSADAAPSAAASAPSKPKHVTPRHWIRHETSEPRHAAPRNHDSLYSRQ